MNKKKIVYSLVALMLIAAITVCGTMAILKENTATVTNTFVAAGGGNLIDDPDQFTMDEAPAVYSAGNYTLDTTSPRVLANTYDKLAPAMSVPKDPTIHLQLNVGAEAYLFLVTTSTTVSPLSWSVDPSNWQRVPGYTNLYYYGYIIPKDGIYPRIIVGDGTTVDIRVMSGDSFTVFNGAIPAGFNNSTLSFKAFIVQAQGNATPLEAWTNAGFTGSGAVPST